MKDLSEDVILSFPGFEKILEPFKSTGDAKVKGDLTKPVDDPHFSGNTKVSENEPPKDSKPVKGKKKNKKARKKLKESINNFRSNTMKSQKNKFDELFENVMGEDDLDVNLGPDDGNLEGEGPLGAALELGDEIGAGLSGEHGDLAAKLENIISTLQDLHAELVGHAEEEEEEGEEEGEEELADADEFAQDEEGTETPEEAVVSEPEPKAHNTQPAVNQLTGKGNKVSASGYTASGGKADAGKIPNVQADPKAHNTQPAVNQMTGKSNKVNSKLGKPGAELFKV